MASNAYVTHNYRLRLRPRSTACNSLTSKPLVYSCPCPHGLPGPVINHSGNVINTMVMGVNHCIKNLGSGLQYLGVEQALLNEEVQGVVGRR